MSQPKTESAEQHKLRLEIPKKRLEEKYLTPISEGIELQEPNVSEYSNIKQKHLTLNQR
jgi:hypothetical protein